MDTLKPQNIGPLYNNTVIGTALAIAGCMGYYIWYSEEGTGRGRSTPRSLLDVPNVTAHAPINGQCTNFTLFDAAVYITASAL